MNPNLINSDLIEFDTTPFPPTILTVISLFSYLSANSIKYSFVALGNSFVSVNNIGAFPLVPAKCSANGAAANPSTNEFPFTNTIFLTPVFAASPVVAFFNSVNNAVSLAILTAVSYLSSPANTSTCACAPSNHLNTLAKLSAISC